MAWNKRSGHGKRAKAKTKVGTGIWFVGLSVCGSMIGIKRSDGSKVGMKSTPDLFWNETYLTNGTKVIEVRVGNE